MRRYIKPLENYQLVLEAQTGAHLLELLDKVEPEVLFIGLNRLNLGINSDRLQFLGNDFYQASSGQVRLGGTVSAIASVALNVGSPLHAAGNCFSEPDNAILAPQATTRTFTYFVENLSSPVTCKKPTDNLTDEVITIIF